MCKDSSGCADLTFGPLKLKIIYTLCQNTVPIVLAVVEVLFFWGWWCWWSSVDEVTELVGDEHVEGKRDI